ncbi:MAG: phage holin family protein [Oscillospiraceae bacterium]|nr:phage holin family protein [Oscillospiraceae bacterium]
MEYMGMAGVAAISVIAWLVGEAVTLLPLDNRWIPVICGVCGGALGIVGTRVMPDFPAQDLMSAAAVGIVSGLAATGADQIGKQFRA